MEGKKKIRVGLFNNLKVTFKLGILNLTRMIEYNQNKTNFILSSWGMRQYRYLCLIYKYIYLLCKQHWQQMLSAGLWLPFS
jgi:hypothetical protein